MNGFVDFILGRPPVSGVDYFLIDYGHKIILSSEDIKNGVVRVKYCYSSDSYFTHREFHAIYSKKKSGLIGKFEGVNHE